MQLPIEYTEEMKRLLGEEYESYIKSFEEPRYYGLRVNTLKIEPEQLKEIAPFHLSPIPWCENGFYYEKEDNPAKHPLYHAGLYYIQEPSAMTPARFLPVEPGDKVLDLCAAPGGKTTELGAKLKGEGVLVSNDISITRTKALLHNIELCGIGNIVVTSETPEKLAERFTGYFDKILVDAPCSGEGMFRKDPLMIKAWSPQKVEEYSAIQRQIIVEAVKMLKPGGMMIYSTCTFAPEENEQSIEYLLEQCPEMSLSELPLCDGFDQGHPEWSHTKNEELKKCRRLWPHKLKGEGHFVALLQKSETAKAMHYRPYRYKKSKMVKELDDFLKEAKLNLNPDRIEIYEERVFYMPEELADTVGLRVVRSGLFLGHLKKKRFEPSQCLAMYLKAGQYKNEYSFSLEDENLIRYLKCETLSDVEGEKGNILLEAEHYPLGWGKLAGNSLKNKYNPSWRWMRG